MLVHYALSTLHYFPVLDLFNPAQTSTPRGAYSQCCRIQRKGLVSHKAISSSQVLSYGWVNQSPNDDIAVAGLEPATFWLRVRRFNHCAITAGYGNISSQLDWSSFTHISHHRDARTIPSLHHTQDTHTHANTHIRTHIHTNTHFNFLVSVHSPKFKKKHSQYLEGD